MSSWNPREVVLFLGAGFSRYAGLPVMTSFGKASDKERQRIHDMAYRKDRGRFMEAGDVFETFRRHCRKAGAVIEVDADDMEAIFCAAEALIEAGRENIDIENQRYSLKYIIEQIQLWLWKIYQQLPPIDFPDLGKPYEKFVAILKEHLKAPTVLTTNYDLVLEYLAWKSDLLCFYPLPEHLRPVCGSLNLELGSPKEAFVSLVNSAQCPMVCKLHGSVNFFNMGAGEREDQVSISTSIAGPCDKNIGASAIPARGPAIRAFDGLWSLRARYGGHIIPAIIPPTYAKLQGHGWLRHIWREASTAISRARLIVFIGYSMPESDGFFRAMVRGALADRQTPDRLRVFAIDPSGETLERYRKLFLPLNLRCKKELQELRFEDSLDFLESVLSGPDGCDGA